MPLALRQIRGQPLRQKWATIAAPVGGDDTVSPGTAIPITRSIFSYNLIGAELGLRSRLGWKEWVTGLDGEIRSLPGFTGSTSDGSTSRLFGCTQTGIWGCSASTDSPTQEVTFGTQNALSGYGEHCAFTDLNSAHWLLYCDEANGYHTYAENGGVWTKVVRNDSSPGVGEIGGVDPANLVQPLVHQNRVWLVERDSQAAWYLGLNALYGAATRFNFGTHFPHGGDLRCLASWNVDGGSGPESRLVAVSGGGDVVIYQGTDPSSASTWRIVSQWYIGAVPSGRRLTTNTGGDVAVMSSIGILPLSKLVVGNQIVDRSQYATLTVANLWNQLQAATSTLPGWSMRLHPQDAALIVLVPTAINQPSQQLVMSMITRGWHRYRDIPIGLCAEPWGGTLYFGTLDGRVCVNDGYLDGVTLADPNSYSAIDWSLLTAFTNQGSPIRKRIQQIRVKVGSQGGSTPINAEARYNLDMSEAAAPAPAVASGTSTWDNGLWDQAKWSGSYQIDTRVFGAYGSGQEMALAIRGKATSRMTLIGADVAFDVGGYQ